MNDYRETESKELREKLQKCILGLEVIAFQECEPDEMQRMAVNILDRIGHDYLSNMHQICVGRQ